MSEAVARMLIPFRLQSTQQKHSTVGHLNRGIDGFSQLHFALPSMCQKGSNQAGVLAISDGNDSNFGSPESAVSIGMVVKKAC